MDYNHEENIWEANEGKKSPSFHCLVAMIEWNRKKEEERKKKETEKKKRRKNEERGEERKKEKS